MWRYEVAYINENGWYMCKGFGYADKFERFLMRLKKKGLKIVKISDWDGEGIGKKMNELYM